MRVTTRSLLLLAVVALMAWVGVVEGAVGCADPNCNTCPGNPTVCTGCNAGYLLLGSTCTACVQNCAVGQCTGTTTCAACDTGFFLSTDQATCSLCTGAGFYKDGTSCKQCSALAGDSKFSTSVPGSQTVAAGVSACSGCVAGYYVSTLAVTTPGSLAAAQCMTCSDSFPGTTSATTCFPTSTPPLTSNNNANQCCNLCQGSTTAPSSDPGYAMTVPAIPYSAAKGSPVVVAEVLASAAVCAKCTGGPYTPAGGSSNTAVVRTTPLSPHRCPLLTSSSPRVRRATGRHGARRRVRQGRVFPLRPPQQRLRHVHPRGDRPRHADRVPVLRDVPPRVLPARRRVPVLRRPPRLCRRRHLRLRGVRQRRRLLRHGGQRLLRPGTSCRPLAVPSHTVPPSPLTRPYVPWPLALSSSLCVLR